MHRLPSFSGLVSVVFHSDVDCVRHAVCTISVAAYGYVSGFFVFLTLIFEDTRETVSFLFFSVLLIEGAATSGIPSQPVGFDHSRYFSERIISVYCNATSRPSLAQIQVSYDDRSFDHPPLTDISAYFWKS